MISMGSPAIFATEYDRSECRIGIVHVGYGAFHRAHQAVYVDDYMERTGDLDWGIAAVNLRNSESEAFADAAAATDGYLLKYTGTTAPTSWRMVRPHLAFCDWSREAEAAESLVALDTVHAITITVTESGYYLDDAGRLNTGDPVIAEEIAGGPRRSIFGYLAAALKRRHAAGAWPISVLCCDNIRGNGKMLRRSMLDWLEAAGDAELAAWVAAHVTFPCSMVDRITPRSTPTLLDEAKALFPDCAHSPVHSEDYIQWVLEDNFAATMPDLGRAGVEIVADVDPYEEAKIRILNGGHTGLAYLGALAGHATFDEAMRDAVLRRHFDCLEQEEVLPGLQLELPFDRSAYCHRVAERFANEAIADALERICMDGFAKFPIFIRPTIEGCLAQGITPRRCFESVASWYVYARRSAENKTNIPYHEPNWHLLEPMLQAGREADFATSSLLWGDLPDRYPGFANSIVNSIEEMDKTWPA
ncbi:MAG: mannitol dehydrogenase family protein [Pseudomonadota bacterium]|nr:mannitol dehydrogenase family protein [Pseudomonadota bacterium]MEC8127937.1 mannitol dehydrogenase family protein [Pseudomonadota bacterium]